MKTFVSCKNANVFTVYNTKTVTIITESDRRASYRR